MRTAPLTWALGMAALFALLPPSARAAEPAPTEAARAAIAALAKSSPELRVAWSAEQVAPRLLTRISEPTAGDGPDDQARSFLERWPALYGAQGDLRLLSVQPVAGRVVVRYQQSWHGLPVEGAELVVTLEGERVIAVSGSTSPLIEVRAARIGELQARRLAARAVFGEIAGAESSASVLGRVVRTSGGRGVEVYKLSVLRRPLVEQLEVLVDAHDGRVIGVSDRAVW